MGSIKDRNGMDLREAEDIKKMCPYVRCVALHTEVSLYEPRMFLRDEVH